MNVVTSILAIIARTATFGHATRNERRNRGAPPACWHQLGVDETLRKLATTASGLTAEEAAQRLARHGENVLPQSQRRSAAAMLLGQFSDFMIIVLLAAAVVSGLVGEPLDTAAILVIVLLNAVIGTVQEYRAERAVAALRAMAAPAAAVLRDAQVVTVAATKLVPGDVVMLEAGNVVPADLRLLEVEELQADESALTGESVPNDKHNAQLPATELPLGDRANLAFRSSLITRGRGVAVVVATGLDTEIGSIAAMLRGEGRVKTPLQVRLARFGRYLALAVLAICALVFTAGLLQGQPAMLMFLTAVSLAVAAIPEALPAVVAVSLALGARKLIRQHALVRNLPAVETLGSVTVICADKTGTLTRNRMTAELFVTASEKRDGFVAPDGPAPWPEFGCALALNNDIADVDGRAAGEPTELALFEAARDAGYNRDELLERLPRSAVIPFDSDRKAMTTLHTCDRGAVAYVKGAPEKVLLQCVDALGPDGVHAFDPDTMLHSAAQLANDGYRVLAVARRVFDQELPEPTEATLERKLTFLGLVALIDPPRPEAFDAVADCLAAGIKPVMITGDHPGTAHAIARRLGIADSAAKVLTGVELASLSDDDFASLAGSVNIYARVSPEQKLRIVKTLQRQGEFVAMTGDGVNDAPALKRADIGVAMGQKGTDVAREAADMVLLNDDFATIVSAVRAGRRIYDNIRKFIKDTMSSNSGEIWTLLLAPLFGLPIPLLPIHILWINLVTDGLPGLAFTAEPAEPGLMRRAPRPPDESVFAHGMWQHILWVGLFVGAMSIASQAWSLSRGFEYWQTVVFTVLTVSQLFHSIAVRSESASLLSIGVWSNPHMLGAVVLALALHLAVVYVPALNTVFHTQPLPLADLLVCLLLSSLVLVAIEFEKWLVRCGVLYRSRPVAESGH